MENWLVRSNMSGRPHYLERRDVMQSSTPSASMSRPQRLIRRGPNLGTPRRKHRGAVRPVDEMYQDYEFSVSRAEVKRSKETLNSTLATEGYMLTCTQIQLLPGICPTGKAEATSDFPSWDSVAQLKCVLEEDIFCPICLYPPVSPRMERCGHIYCGPCVVQYVNFDNEGLSKKCAVCSWTLRIKDLKRVEIEHVDGVKVGSNVTMTLISRIASNNGDYLRLFSPSTDEDVKLFQFVVGMSGAELRAHYVAEIEVLNVYKMTCKEEGTTELIPAINFLLSDLQSKLKTSSCHKHIMKKDDVQYNTPDTTIQETLFYQEINGCPIFLDGLMWKCLLAEYSTPANLPNPLTANITAVRSYKMSPAVEKRWRHLSHLPMGHTFLLIEIDLKPLVSEVTLAQFSSALGCRAAEQARRQMEDLRLTRLKEDAENRIPFLPAGFTLSGHAPLATNDQSYQFDLSDFVPLVSSDESETKKIASRASFADVTKSGALSVLDHKRVATFGRGADGRRSGGDAFNPAMETWPKLGATTPARAYEGKNIPGSESGQARSVWSRRSLFGRKSPTSNDNQ